jgi:hypothetical protein
MSYLYLPSVRQTGSERFTLGGQPLSHDLLSFWQWSASDLIGNTTRGGLAEYIVAMALDITSGVRNDWESYDLLFNEWKIEVKASAYLQTWPQRQLSRPVFSIRPARSWDPISGLLSIEVRRHSDLYVFCLNHHKDKATLNPRDLTQWTFYILPTSCLENSPRFKHVETISFSSLLTLNPSKSSYKDLKESITKVMWLVSRSA